VPPGVIRFSAAIGTAQYALREIIMNFMREFPMIDLVEHVTSRQVDLNAENIDVAIRAHSGTLPDSTLVQRTLATSHAQICAVVSLCRSGNSPGWR
jgi:DNA-binding transcriptional LysR family regulator